MKILADTCIWIEYFSKNPKIDPNEFESLLLNNQIVICLPIKAELESGSISKTLKKKLSQTFNFMQFVDPNWNDPKTWEEVSHLADLASKNRIAVSGLVDRMILLSCKQNKEAKLWTLDTKLSRLAKTLNLSFK